MIWRRLFTELYVCTISVTPPSQRVQFILGENDEDSSGMHESHPLFSEMETLCTMENGELEWKETAR